MNKDESNISYSFRWRERELTHGAWGEGSKDVQELVDVIAKSRLKHQVDPGNKQIAKKRQ